MALTIDGTAISNVTIDGAQVQEVTIDGVTVWLNAYVEQPSPISPDGATDIGETVTLEASDFSVYSGTDTMVESEWVLVNVDTSTTIYQNTISH